jgi:hypothetical protein
VNRYQIVPRTDADVSRQYIRARVAGLEVSHGPLNTKVFDSIPAPGIRPGVFRYIGILVFHKETRRWEARACANASAVDLSTVISFGLYAAEKFGAKPGQWTRQGGWMNQPSLRTGKPVAWINVCYQLGEDDLLGAATHEVVVTDEALYRVLDGTPA